MPTNESMQANPSHVEEILVSTRFLQMPAEMTFRKPVEKRAKQELRKFEKLPSTNDKVKWILMTLHWWPYLLKDVFEMRHKNKRVKDMARAAIKQRKAEKAKAKKKAEQAKKKAKGERDAKRLAKKVSKRLAKEVAQAAA